MSNPDVREMRFVGKGRGKAFQDAVKLVRLQSQFAQSRCVSETTFEASGTPSGTCNYERDSPPPLELNEEENNNVTSEVPTFVADTPEHCTEPSPGKFVSSSTPSPSLSRSQSFSRRRASTGGSSGSRSRTSSIGSDLWVETPDGGRCYCNRAVRDINCCACGHTFRGRIQKPCPTHPNVIHLMDHRNCPNCRSTLLKEFSSAIE